MLIVEILTIISCCPSSLTPTRSGAIWAIVWICGILLTSKTAPTIRRTFPTVGIHMIRFLDQGDEVGKWKSFVGFGTEDLF